MTTERFPGYQPLWHGNKEIYSRLGYAVMTREILRIPVYDNKGVFAFVELLKR
jgi:hypothetical protein